MKAITILFLVSGLAVCQLVFPGQAAGQEYYGHWTGIKVGWISPGDDLNVGTAHEYDLRYSTSWISNTNWSYATSVDCEPRPLPAGISQRCYVSGLAAGVKYYVGIKTADEVYNWSPLSKIFSYTAKEYSYRCGDVTDDGLVNLADITALISYVYLHGQSVRPEQAGNVNGDPTGTVNLSDITLLIAMVYLHASPRPCE